MGFECACLAEGEPAGIVVSQGGCVYINGTRASTRLDGHWRVRVRLWHVVGVCRRFGWLVCARALVFPWQWRMKVKAIGILPIALSSPSILMSVNMFGDICLECLVGAMFALLSGTSLIVVDRKL